MKQRSPVHTLVRIQALKIKEKFVLIENGKKATTSRSAQSSTLYTIFFIVSRYSFFFTSSRSSFSFQFLCMDNCFCYTFLFALFDAIFQSIFLNSPVFRFPVGPRRDRRSWCSRLCRYSFFLSIFVGFSRVFTRFFGTIWWVINNSWNFLFGFWVFCDWWAGKIVASPRWPIGVDWISLNFVLLNIFLVGLSKNTVRWGGKIFVENSQFF